MPKTNVFLVDDDKNICSLIKMYLERENFSVTICHSGDEAIEVLNNMAPPPGIILLDVMLPGADGWFILREVRKKTATLPIIMLTAKGETYDKILGLELGADDYITKPFDPKELIARIKAVMRRSMPEDKQTITMNEFSVSLTTYKVTYRGEKLDMTPKEIELLFFLAGHPNKVYTREQLLEAVWGYDYFGDSRTIDVHVKRLREKLEGSVAYGWQIATVWGVGYKFEVK